MRDPIVAYDIFERPEPSLRYPDIDPPRTYLIGLTDLNDWKLLGVFDEPEDIDRWCSKTGEAEQSWRDWFTLKGVFAS